MSKQVNRREFHHVSLGARLLMCLGLVWLSPALQAQNANVDPTCPPTASGGPGTINLHVQQKDGDQIPVGYRWLVEEDATFQVTPGAVQGKCALAVNLHRSYMPVVATGRSTDGSNAAIEIPDVNKRYYVSVVPDQGTESAPADCTAPGQCFTQTGRQAVFNGTSAITVNVVVTPQPIPTSQIWVRAFEDTNSINNAWDTGEAGLGGFMVFVYDMGGQMAVDVFGNPIGTEYVDGSPGTVTTLGNGTIRTMTALEAGSDATNPDHLAVGEALIKYLAPGKYGVQVIPKAGEGWQQTHTIEGTRGIDAWILAGESRYGLFAEFGPGFHHADIGFVKPMNNLSDAAAPVSGTIKGRITNMHMSRPPNYTMYSAQAQPNCWVGINDMLAGAVGAGRFTSACNADSTFSIPNVPPGTYQLVIWDSYLLNIFSAQSVTINPDGSSTLDGNTATVAGFPDIPVFRWFGTHENWVYLDLNGNGKRDAGEAGIPEQAVNLRYRDGSIYMANVTDSEGFLPFEGVFPFFSWLVAEVDFARFKATGLTLAVDDGGQVTGTPGADYGPGNVGHGALRPQGQNPADGGDVCASAEAPGCLVRTETGPVLTQGVNTFLGTTTVFEWGKQPYGAGENGGISGIVQYATTRAENDPRYAAAETWETGIPRVQVNLYRSDVNGNIANVNGVTGIQLADVDNYPFNWSEPGVDALGAPLPSVMGPEDLDRPGNGLAGVFSAGDAVNIVHTDSWDDSPPTNCVGDPNDAFHDGDGTNGANAADSPFEGKCYDGLRNYQQARPAVFDGGYAFFDYVPNGMASGNAPVTLVPGSYVVTADTPPGYLHQTEESKNVDFGDAFKAKAQALPPVCVGAPHTVPSNLTLFPGVGAPFAGSSRPLCDSKVVVLADGKNTGASFFMYTEVPVTGHIKGFVLNDLTNEFNPLSPNFGEKFAPAWLPISIRDYAGNEINHIYTDEYGVYNAVVPSSVRINAPMPSGVSPNMAQVCLNAPTMEDPANPGVWIPDPHFDKHYSQFCYTFNFTPGQTTYADTPILPISAYTGDGNFALDGEYPNGTPVISRVDAGANGKGGGPYLPTSGSLTVMSRGTVMVPDPSALTGRRIDGSSNVLVERHYGFSALLPDGSVDPGSAAPRVFIGGTEVTVSAGWTNDMLVVDVPAGTPSGQLTVVKADGTRSRHGVYVTIGMDPNLVRFVSPGGNIQAAINDTPAGGLTLVAPGNYSEMLFITKPIALQGWGADSSFINAVQSPVQKIEQWRIEANRRVNCLAVGDPDRIGLLQGEQNNLGNAGNVCSLVPGTGLFTTYEGPAVFVAPDDGVFSSGRSARIDGLTITGSDQSAGVLLHGYARFAEVSNNIITSNQGPSAAGIRVGNPELLNGDEIVSGQNENVYIHHNLVTQNGGLTQPGAGIGVYTGSDGYRIVQNWVSGNFSQSDGAGVAHYGYSQGGVIADNHIIFNQGFDQTVAGGGNGGGLLIAGITPQVGAAIAQSPGSGSVLVLRNVIQGNHAGSGDGGGILLRRINGQDVLASSLRRNWNRIDILNNMIVNNVAGYRGAGVIMQDALNVDLFNNTIANNDSTATAGNAIDVGLNNSTAQPAGVVLLAPSSELLAGLNAVQRAAVADVASNPQLINNIILGNRSFEWTTSTPVGGVPGAGTPGAGGGTLAPAAEPFWDLDVEASVDAPLLAFRAVRNILTNNASNSGYTNNPKVAGTLAAEQALMVNPYWNCSPPTTTGSCVLADGTIHSGEFNTLLVSAAALDEGGNFIDVHYGPLTLGDSNYHLTATSSAIDSGRVTPPPGVYLGADIDGNPRVGRYDIGADEYAAVGANVAPMIVPDPTNLRVLQGTSVSFRVPATDPNIADTLAFSITGVQIMDSLGAWAPVSWGSVGAPVIDPATGVLTWIADPVVPFPAGSNNANNCNTYNRRREFQIGIVVSDGASSTPGTVYVQVCREASSDPTANPDAYNVTAVANFMQLAPGVLANDTNPNANRGGGALVASLVTDTPSTVGHVALAANGGFTFSPVATWVGTGTFDYRISDGLNTSQATVTLSRSFSPTLVRYTNGSWMISGVRTAGVQGCYRAYLGSGALIGTAYVAAGETAWSITAGAPAFPAGDTVTVNSVLAVDEVECLGGGGTVQMSIAAIPVIGNTATSESLTTAWVQCPGDTDGDGQLSDAEQTALGLPAGVKRVCKHLAASDGYIRLADNKELYAFGFSDVSGVAPESAIKTGLLDSNFPAPTLAFDEGDEVFLTLTNVGMMKRPDLFDPHSVHFHGFPNAATVFDGVPESGVSVNMGSSLTYFYKIVEPGTYMYHCHVEAAEHMQMGMLGNLFVRPKQNKLPAGTLLGSYAHRAGDLYAYNDGDGSTRYDVEAALQIGSMDSVFHDEHIAVQPLPFANMRDDYGMLNGRGYPQTVVNGDIPVLPDGEKATSGFDHANESSQKVGSLVTATQGQKILLRITNLNVTRFYTMGISGGLNMKVIGKGAHILRGPGGQNLSYDTGSVTLGGGESFDVIIDTTGVAQGTYVLYAKNLDALSNGEDPALGGMMTEIRIN
ncbi:MAG: multicopper oxidase domain-containing protein [Gammaproteobacteria bacterium]|nr:multicopper oxidase domain-containing protein [Gammaproteobacteria bacterium]